MKRPRKISAALFAVTSLTSLLGVGCARESQEEDAGAAAAPPLQRPANPPTPGGSGTGPGGAIRMPPGKS